MDQLVLGKAGAVLLLVGIGEPHHVPPGHARAPITALFARLTAPRLKSS